MVSKKLVDCMESDICRGLCGCSCMEYEAYPNEEFVVCCDPRRVGKEHTLLCGKRSWSYPAKLQVGPDWPVVMLVYSLMVCVYVPVLYLIYTYVRIEVFIVGVILSAAVLLSYTSVACADPGILWSDERETLVQFKLRTEGRPQEEERKTMDKGSEENSEAWREYRNAEGKLKMVPMSITSGDVGRSGSGSVAADIPFAEATSAEASVGVDLESGSGGAAHPSDDDTSTSHVELQPLPTRNLILMQADKSFDCSTCDMRRSYQAIHCRHCNVCIEHVDHHCPWSGQCIAQGNIVAFRWFLSTLCCTCWFMLISLIYALYVIIDVAAEDT